MPDRNDLFVIPVEFATPEYDGTVRLRYEILRKPLGLFFTENDLAAEYRPDESGLLHAGV